MRGEKWHLVDGYRATRVVFVQISYGKEFDRDTILELMTLSEKLVEIWGSMGARNEIVVE